MVWGCGNIPWHPVLPDLILSHCIPSISSLHHYTLLHHLKKCCLQPAIRFCDCPLGQGLPFCKLTVWSSSLQLVEEEANICSYKLHLLVTNPGLREAVLIVPYPHPTHTHTWDFSECLGHLLSSLCFPALTCTPPGCCGLWAWPASLWLPFSPSFFLLLVTVPVCPFWEPEHGFETECPWYFLLLILNVQYFEWWGICQDSHHLVPYP